MTDELEDLLRRRLHAQAAGAILAPNAVTTAAERGRRRLRRRRAAAGGGMVLALVAVGTAVGIGWADEATPPVVVISDGPTSPAVEQQAGPPLLTRSYKDNYVGRADRLTGTLVVTDNCLTVESDGGRTGIVWAPGWSTTIEDGKVVVRDLKGEVRAREGKKVKLYGGSGTDYASRYGDDRCWTDRMWLANAKQASEPLTWLKRSDMKVKPDPPDPSLNEKSLASEVISVVAERIVEWGEERGYAHLRTDAANRAIELLWKGKPPADIREYIASKPYGVTVVVDESARYSNEEVQDARARLLNSDIREAVDIVTSSLDDDGGGIEIGISQTEPLTEEQMAHLRAVAGIDEITVRTGVESMRNWGLTPGLQTVSPSPRPE